MKDPLKEIEEKLQIHKRKKRLFFLRILGGLLAAGCLIFFGVWVILGSFKPASSPASVPAESESKEASKTVPAGSAGFDQEKLIETEGESTEITVSLMGH